MDKENKKLHRVCFTGHRPESMPYSEKKIKALLRPVVERSIEEGYCTFITGMARGFDLWAADVVLKAKKKHKEVRLICALPISDFEKRWSWEEQEHYQDILKEADHVTVVCDHYFRACFQGRNMFMVDHAQRVIAAYTGAPGGTQNTIRYAQGKNREIINILEK